LAGSVAVVGGPGYIGGAVIGQLSGKLCAFQTTGRDKAGKGPDSQGRRPGADGCQSVFQAVLINKEKWIEIIAGYVAVAHVAVLIPLAVARHEDELAVPVRYGILWDLRSARNAGVTRFGRMISVAALACGYLDNLHFNCVDRINRDAIAPPSVGSGTVAERDIGAWMADNAGCIISCLVNPVTLFGPIEHKDFSTLTVLVTQTRSGSIPVFSNSGFSKTDIHDVGEMNIPTLKVAAKKVNGVCFSVAMYLKCLTEMDKLFRCRVQGHSGKDVVRRAPDFALTMLAWYVAAMKQMLRMFESFGEAFGKQLKEVFDLIVNGRGQVLEATLRGQGDGRVVRV